MPVWMGARGIEGCEQTHDGVALVVQSEQGRVGKAQRGPEFHGMGLASCAVSGKRRLGRPGVLDVDFGRGDHQVELVGAVDVSRHAIEVI